MAKIADELGQTPAQVLLRWHLCHGTAVIPKSFTPERIRENFGIFDISLTAEHIDEIDALDSGVRSGRDPELVRRAAPELGGDQS